MGQYLQRNEQTPSVSTLTKVGYVFFFLKKNKFLSTTYRSNAEKYVKIKSYFQWCIAFFFQTGFFLIFKRQLV